VSVQGVEALECFAVFRKVQATVGQYTVNIEKNHLDALRLKQQLGRKIEGWLNCLRGIEVGRL
jgi:hypothetical protein